MNILHVNTRISGGGAAVAAVRLHQGLKLAGHTSRFMVGTGSASLPEISSVPDDWRTPWLHRIIPFSGLNYLEYLGSYKIAQTDFFKQADILNLHNLHRDYFSYPALAGLTKITPAVWTLHDMWAFTGHCAYSFDCQRWVTGCGRCPHLTGYPEARRDATKWEWRLKKSVYARSDITIVTASRWLEEMAGRSMLAAYFPIKRIPHGINTTVYRAMDKTLCRTVLGLPKNKKVLMFAAVDTEEFRKGGDLLLSALKTLPDSLKADLILLIMGAGQEARFKDIDMKIVSLGYVDNDVFKVIGYNAADVFLFPSRADIWSLVVQEAMSCGTPSVAFDVGGVADLVRHRTTGLLVPPEDTASFKDAIVELLEDRRLYQTVSSGCEKTAADEYTIELQASRYLSLYQEILKSASAG